jgi:general secretion pathway protein J
MRTDDQVTVLEGFYAFRFSYLERKDGGERWVARWTDRGSLPVLLRLEILDRVPGGTPLPPLVFRPRVEAEQGCVKPRASVCTIGVRAAPPGPTTAPPERKQ